MRTETIIWPTKTRELHNHHFDSTIWNDFRFRDDDIVISTYAKSGTTWTQQIVAQVLFGPDPDLEVAEMSPWLDLRIPPKEVKLPMVEAQSHRRFLKTHLPLDALVFSPEAKYIYIGRDGRDVVWSMHNHHANANGLWYEALNDTPGRVGPPIEPPPADIRQYWRDWLERDGHPFWPFWENVRTWWEFRDLPNVLFVHFANLKRDMPKEMRRIAEFLDVTVDEGDWDEILEYCSFDWMKRHAAKSVPLGGAFWDAGAQVFINRGVNGRWADTLTPEDVAEYEARAVQELGPECARWLATGEVSSVPAKDHAVPRKLDNGYRTRNDKQEVSSMITEKGSAVREFMKNFHGEVILPGDEGYDEARKVFNGMIDRRPALIARCVDTQDVVRCVRFAREHDLLVSVRGGGHSVAGHGVCDDGLMIDLSLMKGVEVDVMNQVAKAQPGVRLGEFIVETEKYGLVSPTGTVSDTGLAGLTLGGGYGYLSGKYGLALDNLLSAEVVTADGRVLRASAEEHPDLYWALRGGSGNFGVVTSFELKLHPVTQVLGGMVVHPFERAGEVLRFYREVAASAPDELTTYAALATTPDGQQAVAIMPCYCGPIEEGERIIAPIRAFGPPIADLIRPMKYSEMNTLVDAANPSGMQNYWKGNLMSELSDGAIDAIVEHAARVPSPRTVILIDQLHGAASRVAHSEAAFAHRDTRHNVMTMSMWEDPADAEVNIAWTRGLSAAIEPYAAGGVYVNGAFEQRPFAAFGANYDRLVEIKTAYDPTNFFRHNQNIRPKARSVMAS